MTESDGRKGRAWFWVGVALLSSSVLFWFILIWGVAANSEDISDTLLAGVIFTVIPVGIGVYGIWWSRKTRAAEETTSEQIFATRAPWKIDLRRLPSGVKTAARWAFAILGLLILFIVVNELFTLRQVPTPRESGIIVFQTGGGSQLFVIAGLLFLVIGVIILCSMLKSLVTRIRRAKTIPSSIWLLLIPFLFIGLGGFWVYSAPLQEEIVVDRPAQVITVEKDYLLWNDLVLRIKFYEVESIKYQRGTVTGVTSSGTPGYSSYNTVTMVKHDGTEIEVYSDGPGTYALAKAIAEAMGKRLVQ